MRIRHAALTLTAAAALTAPLVAAVGSTGPDNPAVFRQSTTGLLGGTGPTLPGLCGPAVSPGPVGDGEPIVIVLPPGPDFTIGKIPTGWWKDPAQVTTDGAWKLAFQGLVWAQGPAQWAATNGHPVDIAAILEQVADFYRADPDPGTTHPDVNTWGWDEGTAMRRLTTLNCLYSLTGDARIRPWMAAEVAVQFTTRYYGPPLHAVHNHGMMANIAVWRAGKLTGNTTWMRRAADRLAAEGPQAFSPAGITPEQSSAYQWNNIYGWTQASDIIRDGNAAAAATLDAALVKARRAYRWMTEPDGSIVQVGDSEQVPGLTDPALNSTARTLVDDSTGWAVGRWSFTDPATTYYTVRYGPRRWGHGHQDRTGVTFTTRGVRVLVGPGKFTTDPASPFLAWQGSPAAHNVAAPGRLTLSLSAWAVRAATTIRAPAHSYTFTDTLYGRRHTRTVVVDRDRHSMRVGDSYAATTATTDQTWRQTWHLDPGWVLTWSTGTGARFRHTSGRVLTVATTGRISSILRGSTRPVAGWHFPRSGYRDQASEMTVRRYGAATVTTFTVT